MMPAVLRTVTATRYVTPLREGGSLPGLVEADDDGLYVVKFRGAGQGPKALAAEIVAGELARALGLPVPELVLVELDPELARAEPDPEIQDLIRASAGLNLGVDFLPGALPYTPARPPRARAGGGGRLARRAGGEHRPHAAQPEPAALARQPVADRPRRRALRAPRRPAIRWRSPGARSRRSATTCCWAPPGRSPEADARLAPLARAGGRGRARAARVGRRRALRRASGAPARGAARVDGGGRACPGVRTSSTRSSASCRTSSAASA